MGMTDAPSSKSRECVGQGVANMASAVFGGMGGCAMIGHFLHQCVFRYASFAFNTVIVSCYSLILDFYWHGADYIRWCIAQRRVAEVRIDLQPLYSLASTEDSNEPDKAG